MPISKTLKYLKIMALVLLITSLSSLSTARAEGMHKGELLIENLNKTLVSVMKNAKELGYKGRYERLEPVVRRTYDFRLITRYSVGRIWKTFNNEEREKLAERFAVLSISTYATRFHGYSGETLTVTSSKPLRRGRLLVRTELKKSNGEIIHLDYVLTKTQGQWRAINVIANGVSDLSLKRAQYTYILRKKSYKSLIKKIDKKIAAYAEKTE